MITSCKTSHRQRRINRVVTSQGQLHHPKKELSAPPKSQEGRPCFMASKSWNELHKKDLRAFFGLLTEAELRLDLLSGSTIPEGAA